MGNLVSMLIPGLHSSRWLRESVSSALAQSWAKKEVVIVDDGSKDDTLAVTRSFRHASVKVATQPNSGAPSTRNHAPKSVGYSRRVNAGFFDPRFPAANPTSHRRRPAKRRPPQSVRSRSAMNYLVSMSILTQNYEPRPPWMLAQTCLSKQIIVIDGSFPHRWARAC